MKKQCKYIMALILGMLFFSCQQEIESYNSPTNRLGFYFPKTNNGQIDFEMQTFTFVYAPETVVDSTIYVELRTLGFVTDYDRPIKIKQMSTEMNDAEVGKHYLSFDDKSIVSQYVVKAGENSVKVPIVLYRHPSLKTEKFNLVLQVVENEHFSLSYADETRKFIEISDLLVKPNTWNSNVDSYFANGYGDVKFRFMLDNPPPVIVDGEIMDALLDEAFFEKYFLMIPGDRNDYTDKAYAFFLSTHYSGKLIEINRDRKAAGLGVLKEADNSPVQFRGASGVLPFE